MLRVSKAKFRFEVVAKVLPVNQWQVQARHSRHPFKIISKIGITFSIRLQKERQSHPKLFVMCYNNHLIKCN